MQHILLDKKSLRAQAQAAREAIAPQAAKAAAKIVAAHLLKLIPADAKIIAGYRAMRGELDISEAMTQLAARGHALCLPVIEEPGLPLFFRRWQMGQKLIKGVYDIDIPPASEPQVIPDIVIVPLLAFDASGHRLGFGAGYYDRTIERLREPGKAIQMIGAAFALQQLERIPAEAHDAHLDAVVTEKGILKRT